SGPGSDQLGSEPIGHQVAPPSRLRNISSPGHHRRPIVATMIVLGFWRSTDTALKPNPSFWSPPFTPPHGFGGVTAVQTPVEVLYSYSWPAEKPCPFRVSGPVALPYVM